MALRSAPGNVAAGELRDHREGDVGIGLAAQRRELGFARISAIAAGT